MAKTSKLHRDGELKRSMAKILKPHQDAELKRFIALGNKIAKRLRKVGVEMTFHINFGPLKKEM